jgi:hypothetical protein
MPNLPAMPIPQGLSGEPIPPGWFAGIWRVVDSLRRIEQTRTPGDGRGRRERTAALVHMTSATEGDVYLTSSEARETGAEIKSLDGGDLVDGAWYVALWLDIDGGSYWTAVADAGDIAETVDDKLSSRGINKTLWGISGSASYDETLDDTLDYRGRIVECAIKQVPSATDSAALTADSDWKTTIIIPAPAADVTIAADSPYSVYVDSGDGSLHLAASAADTDYAVVWIRASAPFGVPATCPTGIVAGAYDVADNHLFTAPDPDITVLYEYTAGSVAVRAKSSPVRYTQTTGCDWRASATATVLTGATAAGATGVITKAGATFVDGEIIQISGKSESPVEISHDFYIVANSTGETFQLLDIVSGTVAQFSDGVDPLDFTCDVTQYADSPYEEYDGSGWHDSPCQGIKSLGTGQWEIRLSGVALIQHYGETDAQVVGAKPIGGDPTGKYSGSAINEEIAAIVSAAT